jgi:arylsulfatase A-like enzyme
MDQNPLDHPGVRPRHRIPLSAGAAIVLAIAFGLCAGYLDIGILFFKKYCWNSEGHFRNARDFPWTVPLGHVVLLMAPGMLLAVVCRLRPVPTSLRLGSWLLATIAIWSALLRMPLYAGASLLLAAGLGRLVGDAVAAHDWRPRETRTIVAGLFSVLGVLAMVSSGRQLVREYRAVAGLPPAPQPNVPSRRQVGRQAGKPDLPAPPRARNVVLIVWDTVRAYNLGLYGYDRATTPNLRKWAAKGVTYRFALSAAPWTFPSHASFFTGQWPHSLNSQWKFTLDAPGPTLAEYLASRGYQTAGFAANTNCCSYESGLDRGFAHFEDYALSPRSLLTRTVAGNWALKNVPIPGDFYDKKWVGLQSRGAAEINDGFLSWLSRRRTDRPFFAFLNYFDAHEPYIPPVGFDGRFGIQPRTAEDFQVLIDMVGVDKQAPPARDFLMARDCYDDCIAFLDDQLGRLLDTLQRQGLLDDTDVIITSDHGEGLGIHGFMGHGYTASYEENGVPLVILSSSAPAGRVVKTAVSLRDLPATVVDLLGLEAGSPFPGRSLAAFWKLPPDQVPTAVGAVSPAFTEQADTTAFQPQPGQDRGHRGFQIALAARDHHFVRDGLGVEQLYHWTLDPYEHRNLVGTPAGDELVPVFRRMLLDLLIENPGTAEVEKAYLADYRRWLQELVGGKTSASLTAGN